MMLQLSNSYYDTIFKLLHIYTWHFMSADYTLPLDHSSPLGFMEYFRRLLGSANILCQQIKWRYAWKASSHHY